MPAKSLTDISVPPSLSQKELKEVQEAPVCFRDAIIKEMYIKKGYSPEEAKKLINNQEELPL